MTNFVTNYFYDLPEDLQQMIYEKEHQMKLLEVFDDLFSKMFKGWDSSWQYCCKHNCSLELAITYITEQKVDLGKPWEIWKETCCFNCGDCKEQCQYECFEKCDVIIYHPERNYDELGKVRQSDPHVMTVLSESDEEED